MGFDRERSTKSLSFSPSLTRPRHPFSYSAKLLDDLPISDSSILLILPFAHSFTPTVLITTFTPYTSPYLAPTTSATLHA